MFVAEVVGNKCKRLEGEDGGIAKPIANAASLFVLGALSKAVNAGGVSWDEKLLISDSLTGLQSEALSAVPAGTEISVKRAAVSMIRTGDFRAMDLILSRLSPQYVENSQQSFGITDPMRNIPFLSAKAFVQMKWGSAVDVGQTYAALPIDQQRPAIKSVEMEKLPPDIDRRIDPNESVLVDQVEWFASMEDLCRAQATLRQLADKPTGNNLRDILVLPPSDITAVNGGRWKSVQYIKGSEPGVLVQSWLLERTDGRRFSVNIMMGSIAPIDETKTNEALAPMIDWLAAHK